MQLRWWRNITASPTDAMHLILAQFEIPETEVRILKRANTSIL
jgi:hypothetical protein